MQINTRQYIHRSVMGEWDVTLVMKNGVIRLCVMCDNTRFMVLGGGETKCFKCSM